MSKYLKWLVLIAFGFSARILQNRLLSPKGRMNGKEDTTVKKYLLCIFAAVFLLSAASKSDAYPNFVTVNSVTNAGTDYTIGAKYFFEAGLYTISPFSGAWNAWGENVVDLSIPRGYMWNMFIYQETTANKYQLGDWTVKYATPAEALNAYTGQSLFINQPSGGDIYFFIEDGFPSDNWGSVTAQVNPVPEPATMLLLASGLVGLAGIRRKFRK